MERYLISGAGSGDIENQREMTYFDKGLGLLPPAFEEDV